MTSLTFNDKQLIITIEGVDKLLAFKGEVKIPLSHITHVQVNHEGLMDFRAATFGIGTIFAGRIQTGTFTENGQKSFWDVHDIQKTILLTLQDDDYTKVVVEVVNPEKAVQAIQEKIGA